MDLTTVREVCDARRSPRWQAGDAWLAGGTYLFSEPQPLLRRLLDLERMGWEALRVTSGGLEIAATCTVTQLHAFVPPGRMAWPAAVALFGPCCRAFSSSFKVWNTATLGGNICLALPAAPLIALTAALEGECVLLAQDGGVRRMPVARFVTGAGRTALAEGELLRSVLLPARALRRRAAVRRASLRPQGRSAALLVATVDPGDGTWRVTVTGSTTRPVVVSFDRPPAAQALREALEQAVDPVGWVDDVHGHPAWRRHMTLLLAEELRTELADEERV
ncbi:FAD binding domain-containing protein [Streptomyces sp. B1I3]|uniref:FAD binding domain-containing protein n=1 Tax=Streptomyces sp. B1I3 TaxID=3042264 RepID=UPI002782C37F|nr:FAD binding domain-containing protein [Streptomyces sp. B1I3]MDQ0798123.1 CO/xanthine dehydrogenase FAD-binding subunit [Streptomyces sp. B1I3]